MNAQRLRLAAAAIAALACLAAPANAHAAPAAPSLQASLSGTTINHSAVPLVWTGQGVVINGEWGQKPTGVPAGARGGWTAVGNTSLTVRGLYTFGGTGYAVLFTAAAVPGQNTCQVLGPDGKPSDKYWCETFSDIAGPQLVVG
ncbi:hypothetical protein ACIQWN_32555 [Streptomyces vinaceus]|uniref:hypothetical protein n=1 Tax=Streptomyces vinaceus TaxID=1960 RepID=UPI0038243854